VSEELAADPASVLTATAVWPFPADYRSPAALRGQLRELNLDLHQAAGSQPGDVPVLDWTTLAVGPPETDTDHRGRVWFHYTATVSTQPLLRGAHRFT